MESARRSKVLSVGEGESKRHAVPFINQPSPASIYTPRSTLLPNSHRAQALFPA